MGEPDRGPSRSRHAAVPGGFAKFFNRVIDAGHWAALPDAARAVYMPLVRLADGGKGFRVAVGTQSLMKHTGLSRSSVKRGIKALQDHRLLVVVRQGGVDASGNNHPNTYQLIIPEADSQPAAPAKHKAAPVQRRTDPGPPQTPAKPSLDRPASPAATPEAVHAEVEPRSADEPQLRSSPQTNHSDVSPSVGAEVEAGLPMETAGRPVAPSGDAMNPARQQVADGLRRWGFDPAEAWSLAQQHAPADVSRALEDVRQLHRGGRLRSATGFLRWVLSESQAATGAQPQPSAPGNQTLRSASLPVTDVGGPVSFEATSTLAGWQQHERHATATAAEQAEAAREADDAVFATLAQADIADWSTQILTEHADQPAMQRLLQPRPGSAGVSRLMRAEIVARVRRRQDDARATVTRP